MRFLEWLCGWNEWLWSKLPDNCEQKDCCRAGVRGNENIAHDGTVACDYCSSKTFRANNPHLFGQCEIEPYFWD